MRILLKSILVVLLSVAVWAQTAPPQSSASGTAKTPAKSTKTTKKKARKAPAPAKARKLTPTEQEINALRAQMQQQQQQFQSELAKRDAVIQNLSTQVSNLQSTATQAQSTAQAAADTGQKNTAALNMVQSSVADLKTTSATTTSTLQKTEKRVGDLEEPAAIHYKGVTITPGGFVALYGFYRSHNTNSDATSTFGTIPFNGTANGNTSEFRMTARHSNLNLMVQGNIKGIKATGYAEVDFEGAAPSGNEVISNSFVPRLREFWGNFETKSGWSFLGGQTWSLITPNRKGIAPKGEYRPATIDGSYLVGYHYAREATFRVTKKISNQLSFAVAVENPETVIQGIAKLPTGFTVITAGTGGNFASVNTSIDIAPDIAAKVALDPPFGHFEFGAITRFFRSRIQPPTTNLPNTGTNKTNQGVGGVFNAGIPLIPKKVDLFVNALAGVGVGRFFPGGGVDVVQRFDGTLQPVRAAALFVGIETHPRPNIDFNIYAGNEYYARTVYSSLNNGVFDLGYGVPGAVQAGCSVEKPTVATCDAVNRDIWEITPVLWYRFWRGKQGTLQWGLEYEYIHRLPWRGNATLPGGAIINPVAIENVVFTGIRYVFP